MKLDIEKENNFLNKQSCELKKINKDVKNTKECWLCKTKTNVIFRENCCMLCFEKMKYLQWY